MIKNIVKLFIIGSMGLVLFFGNVTKVNAFAIANEQSLAGISLTIDNYYETKAIKTSKQEKKEVKKEVEKEKENETTPSNKEEKIVLNLKYDRLGISKVDNYLNIREEAGEDAKIIGKLPKNAGCNIYSIDNGWAKIKSGKVTGYVSSEYLVLDQEAEDYAQTIAKKVATVNTDILNVRYLPSTESRIYTLVSSEEDIEVINEEVSTVDLNQFITANYKDQKEILDEVNKEDMMAHLSDWICVTIDNEKVFVAKDFVDITYTLDRAVVIEELEEDGSSGVSSERAQMVQYAKQFLGNKYVYGGTSLTNGVDCSGFIMRIYQRFGYTAIPRNSSAQAAYCSPIDAKDAKPGDLFFYGNGSGISHVAMCIGNNQVIHASNPTNGIKISNYDYRTPVKIGRIIND